ncbi:MAG TPA: beta-1-3, beta-1-6-glucan biosynthesis protein [Xanthobacteraceae bacterium]|jgi:hypothetical protein|nr:beta-1-3, beta-1-6-glucan biosynthesis protein [Xanthobacteraceae bacterium]
MFHSLFSLAREACAVSVLSAVLGFSAPAVSAENNDAAPPEKAAPAGQEPAKENQKVDEYAEAQKALSGPAGNPECVWLGRRVVSLLWRDDLDTAFRHLDLYDRFGCPSAHIQATFRCLIQHGNNIDPKVADTLNGRVSSCWVNPTNPSIQAPPPPAAANGIPPASH